MCGMGKILVLGSEGLIGKNLTTHLTDLGHSVIEYDIKNPTKTYGDEDLSCKDISEPDLQGLMDCVEDADFVYFLAFDVGGATYLKKYEHTTAFISNNMKIMDNVFGALTLSNKPFVFASSMMTKIPGSTYGILKTLGERYAAALGGLSVRFWNVYGPEEIDLLGRNHAITDFIQMGLFDKQILVKTDGSESRQFIYVDDASRALICMMDQYNKIKTELGLLSDSNSRYNCVEVSNGEWVNIKKIAKLIGMETKKTVNFSSKKDRVQNDLRIDPDIKLITKYGWKPQVTLEEGIDLMVKKYRNNK